MDDSYDNAVAETVIGSYKTEVIEPGKPLRHAEQVECATLGRSVQQPTAPSADRRYPPAEFEATYCEEQTAQADAA